jgi:hypothetical protein
MKWRQLAALGCLRRAAAAYGGVVCSRRFFPLWPGQFMSALGTGSLNQNFSRGKHGSGRSAADGAPARCRERGALPG